MESLLAGYPLNRGSTVVLCLSKHQQLWQMHFSALKFQDFLGKHAPRKQNTLEKGDLWIPSIDTAVYTFLQSLI